jgi:SnoaL-like domain
MRLAVIASAAVLLAGNVLAAPSPSLDDLARDIGRAQSVRDVKTLQRSYSQYGQFGLWNEMSALFAQDGTLTLGAVEVKGRAAIAAFFTREYGHGHQGLEPGALHTALIAAPVVNLSVDGNSAQARWDGMTLLSDAKGNASIEGGIYENDYVRERGIWKIGHLHFHPQYAGPYETGWTNIGAADLPIIPFHYDGDSAGLPVPPPVDAAPGSKATLSALETRVRLMNDEDKVRNLQAAYNYYVDRKMWDDVADLFAADSVMEIGGVGVYDGPKGARRAMERMGPAGLTHGQLNDHLVFDDVAQVLSGGNEAWIRGFELAMVGEADTGEQHWELNVFDNRMVKEHGIWKVREMRLFPVLRSEYRAGWGKSRLSEPVPGGALAPDHPVPRADDGRPDSVIPAFHAPNPGSLQKVGLPPAKNFVATAALTPKISASTAASPSAGKDERLVEVARKLAVSAAYDGAENVNSAYGHLIDDFQWTEMSKLFGEHGAKEVPFAGYYAGADRIIHAMLLEYGDQQISGRAGIAFHWLIQPMIMVASDGRSATARSYLFHPDTSKKPGSASLFGAMYPVNQFVLEDGTWRLWNLSLDEPYFGLPGGWKGGWSSPAPAPGAPPPRPPAMPSGPAHYFGADLVAKFAPDVAITALGVREEHYRGGTGETWEWPKILPMWWGYKNPVSGRTPENFLPDCVPCDYSPDLSMANHGYLLPPTGPE